MTRDAQLRSQHKQAELVTLLPRDEISLYFRRIERRIEGIYLQTDTPVASKGVFQIKKGVKPHTGSRRLDIGITGKSRFTLIVHITGTSPHRAEADLLLANDSNVRKWRCLLWISLGIAFVFFVFTWIWVSDVVVISIIECQSTILILICSVVLDNRIRKLKDRALQAEK